MLQQQNFWYREMWAGTIGRIERHEVQGGLKRAVTLADFEEFVILGGLREEEGIHQTESVAAPAPSPHMREEDLLILRNGNNSEVEKVLHLLVLKQQVRELESKPPDPTSPQSSNWSDMIEGEVEDQLQRNKERYKPQWQLHLTLFQPPGPDQDLGLRVRKNNSTFIIHPNKYPIFSMRCIYWNIRGIANDKSQNRLSKLINKWGPEIVGIAESMIYPTDLPMSFLQSLRMSSALYSNRSRI
ncbi:hypothetical protein IFM89_011981 [Coptis chinensis]|uniref:Endonuclease/exonuclease/phosphatase domain-containing protein n=1 Tax=Coptis chinensis TaxID=261450 RepID=A0A835ICG2_9MAGN|nr:hypothetical protein IFM89_011981 [Coptis chinensis]